MKIKNYIKSNILSIKPIELSLITLSGFLPFVKLFFPSKEKYPKGSIRKVKRNGLEFELDISDYQDYLFYFKINRAQSDILLKNLPKKDCLILDIGANIGQDSLYMAKKLKNRHYKIIAFEPSPNNFKKIKKNVELNHLSNIQLEKLALGNMDAPLAMVEDTKDNNGGFNAYVYVKHYTKKKIMIDQMSLDTYMDQLKSKVDFIKIDVEGYECQVLLGGEKSIQKYRPTLLIVLNEDKIQEQGYSCQELLDFLNKLGYHSIKNARNSKEFRLGDLEKPDTILLCKN